MGGHRLLLMGLATSVEVVGLDGDIRLDAGLGDLAVQTLARYMLASLEIAGTDSLCTAVVRTRSRCRLTAVAPGQRLLAGPAVEDPGRAARRDGVRQLIPVDHELAHGLDGTDLQRGHGRPPLTRLRAGRPVQPRVSRFCAPRALQDGPLTRPRTVRDRHADGGPETGPENRRPDAAEEEEEPQRGQGRKEPRHRLGDRSIRSLPRRALPPALHGSEPR